MQVFVLPPWRQNSEEGASASLETPAEELYLQHYFDKRREKKRREEVRGCYQRPLMYFLQAEEDEHLSAPVPRVYFPFSRLSVTAALGHNSQAARRWMFNVSKGLQLALKRCDTRHKKKRKEKEGEKKVSGRQEPARLAVEPGWLQTAAEVFN